MTFIFMPCRSSPQIALADIISYLCPRCQPKKKFCGKRLLYGGAENEYTGFSNQSLRGGKDDGRMNQEALKVLEERRSCRAYKPEQITEEELQAVLKAGTYAPTGRGRQSPIIVAVQDRETVEQLNRMNARILGTPEANPFYGAPTVLVVLADKNIPTWFYDGCCVMDNLLNAAEAVGLGSCWIHRAKEAFESAEGKALLAKWGIVGDYEGIGHCVLGYWAGEKPAAPARKENYIYYVR